MKQSISVLLAFGVALAFAGGMSAQYAYISTSNGISVVNTVTNAVTATVSMNGQPLGVAVNPAGTFLYVANTSNTVSVIKTATNSVAATVNVGVNPVGVAVNRAGTYVYVTNLVSNTVSVINAATNTVTATVGLGAAPQGIAVNPAGTFVYVATPSDNTITVINTATNAVAATVDMGGTSRNPSGVAVSPSGDYVYVANTNSGDVSVIKTATNTIAATVNVSGVNGFNRPRGVAVNPSGRYVYVSSYDPVRNSGNMVSVIDAVANAVTATIAVPSNNTFAHPVGIAVSPDGNSIYVALNGGNTVSVISAATNAVRATTQVGGTINGFLGSFIGGPSVPVSISPGGIVNSASYAASSPVAPGSLVSAFGAFPVSSTAQADVAPLPTSLSGLSIQFNGIQAPFFYASSTQANIQVPWELAGQTQASVTAGIGGQTSSAQKVNLAGFAPGVFTVNSEGQAAVVDALSGQLISPVNPAKAGTTFISIYCTGLGPVTNQPATGAAASVSVRAETIQPPVVTIGGVPVAVLFAGLAPTFVGLYQINVAIPPAVPGGDNVPLVVSIRRCDCSNRDHSHSGRKIATGFSVDNGERE